MGLYDAKMNGYDYSDTNIYSCTAPASVADYAALVTA
jgi:hypothetical protein